MTTPVAPLIQAFFTQRMQQQLQASAETIAAYRDTFRLFLRFAQQRLGKNPSDLDLVDLDAPFLASFLDYLERERNNCVRTRNLRLAALRSFYKFISTERPELSELIQRVLAIPQKRFERNDISFLTSEETDALLAAPDPSNWLGRRDRTLLLVAVESGLRVSELIALKNEDIVFGKIPQVRCRGKGRKNRSTPLSQTVADALGSWQKENAAKPGEFLFPSRRGGMLSRDAVERIVSRHVATATRTCPSLANKRISPHVLRHTRAMRFLESGTDTATIALWLGHASIETTNVYLHADLGLKQRALDRAAPACVPPGRYRPPDALMAFLCGL